MYHLSIELNVPHRIYQRRHLRPAPCTVPYNQRLLFAKIDNQSDNRDEKQNLSGKREGARKKEKEELGQRKGNRCLQGLFNLVKNVGIFF